MFQLHRSGLCYAELGIDIRGILKKSRGILAGRFSHADVEELDMGGPLVFAMLLACTHVLVSPSMAADPKPRCAAKHASGKLHCSCDAQQWRAAVSIANTASIAFRLALQLIDANPIEHFCRAAVHKSCMTAQAGKLHFGIILGWSVAGSTAVWFVVNNMAGIDSPDSKGTGLYNCTCLLGYGMLPMVLHALLSLLVPR